MRCTWVTGVSSRRAKGRWGLRSDELERVLVQVQRRLCVVEGNAQEYLARERQLEQQVRAAFAELAALREYVHTHGSGTEVSAIKPLTIEEELDRR